MIAFFEQLYQYISIAFGALFQVVQGLFQFLSFIPTMLEFTTSMISFVPAIFTAFFVAGISFAIVLKIVGRKS